MRSKSLLSDEEYAKNESLLFAKVIQITIRAEWFTYLLEKYEFHKFGEWATWKTASQAMTDWLQQILENYEQYLNGELPIEIENTTFPHFPRDQKLLQKMNEIASRSENWKKLDDLDKKHPGFAELILALETKENFINYYRAECARALETGEKPKSATLTTITHQFIEQLADRLYAK